MSEQKKDIQVSLDKDTVEIVLKELVEKYNKLCPSDDNNYYLRNTIESMLSKKAAKIYSQIVILQTLVGEPVIPAKHTLEYYLSYVTKMYKMYELEYSSKDEKEEENE